MRDHMESRDRAKHHGDVLAYAFYCLVAINGRAYELLRDVGTQRVFYRPVAIDGESICRTGGGGRHGYFRYPSFMVSFL
jgi:hypothetical protein